jgi:HCOMODA/2-hydroxy-3-carboxy-muconic semialdehyde decarboxylase
MPTTTSPADLVTTLVVANRILYRHGVVDGFGHVSARSPGAPERFLLSRSLAPGQVTRADVMTFDLDGNPQHGDARQPYLERFIHGEIYRARPDVGSIVHSHSPSVIPFGATRQALKPLYHMSSFIGAGSAIFEIREAGGDTDMLIRDRPLGVALARSLGDRAVVLMRGHGSTVVGASIEEAVFRAIYTEMNARLQMQALALGEPVYLNLEEAARSTRTNQGVLRRAWDLWAEDVGPLD